MNPVSIAFQLPFRFGAGLPHYVEVVTDDASLSSALAPVCDRLLLPFTVLSATAFERLPMVGARLARQFRARMDRIGCLPDAFRDAPTTDYVGSYIADRFYRALEADAFTGDGSPLLRWDESEAARLCLPRIIVFYVGATDARSVHERLAVAAGRIPLEFRQVAFDAPESGSSAWDLTPASLAVLLELNVRELIADDPFLAPVPAEWCA